MNHIQFETNGVRCLAVGVSDDAYDFKMMESKFLYPGELILTYKSPVIWDNYKKRSWLWDTKGQYEILAISTDLTGEQLEVILPLTHKYRRFSHLMEILRSHGIDPTEKYVILIERK